MYDGKTEPCYLIVNADDFAYFRCVSRGIVEAHRHGIVTATGILGNSPCFDEDIRLLEAVPALDLGVHLNVTEFAPLTQDLRDRLAALTGKLPGKATFLRALISRRVSVADVVSEWRAQIERCLQCNLSLSFLNSHEHLHMWPSLFGAVQDLAREYDIPYIRFPTAEVFSTFQPASVIRDLSIKILEKLNRPRLALRTPFFLGMSQSGKLSEAYVEEQVRHLVPGRAYELMCHPGYLDSDEVKRPELIKYHDWEGELKVLTSERLRFLRESQAVKLIGFRDLRHIHQEAA